MTHSLIPPGILRLTGRKAPRATVRTDDDGITTFRLDFDAAPELWVEVEFDPLLFTGLEDARELWDDWELANTADATARWVTTHLEHSKRV